MPLKLPTRLRTTLAIWLCLCGVATFGQNGDRAGETQPPPPAHLKSPPAPALTPAEALQAFTLPPGFRMELVASEPLVFDPVAMSIGPDGRLWVVEMRAFMRNVDGAGEDAPIGTIAVLEDANGDGRMDRRTEFVGGLVMPRAIAPVAGGVLVAEPPNLWFFEDTNRDGKADKRTRVAADYGDTSNPEHTANGLLWAMDNWIYSANHTTRFRYDRGTWRREPTSFRGQWGITQDDIGRLYYNDNSQPLRMDVLPANYLGRNPRIVAPRGVNYPLARAEEVPVWPGRITLGVNRGYNTLRDDGTLRLLTAACGPVIYRGSAFPHEFYGDAFIAEPAANLVKRLKLGERAGVPWATNAYDRAEFLTSTDERFRPVNLYNGPDGGLYVVDMYRGIIQHRIYLTTYLRNQIEERSLEAPVGMGRIWRITAGPTTRLRKPRLDRASSAQLVESLAHENAWWRDTAQRLLVERRDASVVPALRKLARGSNYKPARLQALWTLEGVDAIDWPTVEAALAAADVDVAVAGARLAEKFLTSDTARVMQAFESRLKWSEPAFLRQAALSLGAGPAPIVDDTLALLARRHGALPFMADALVSSWAGRESEALERLTADSAGARAVIASLSAAILQSGQAASIDKLLARAAARNTPAWMSAAILDGVDRFIPGEGNRQRAAFLPAEPAALREISRRDDELGRRAIEALKFLSWQGQAVDSESAVARLSRDDRARYELGREEYRLCAGCHQPRGQGMPGLAPALVSSPWVNGKPGALARIVLQGKTSGELTMPPLSTLDDEKIAAVLTFIRRSWGHEASPVTADEVKAVRQQTTQREEPWNEHELRALP